MNLQHIIKVRTTVTNFLFLFVSAELYCGAEEVEVSDVQFGVAGKL